MGKVNYFRDDRNEFAAERLVNQNNAAEGTNLPLRQFGEFRVPFVTNLQIIRVQPLFGFTEFTIGWVNADSNIVSNYNVYAYGAYSDNTKPIGPFATQASPCILKIPASVDNQPITFEVQTVLNNGQQSLLGRSPSVTGLTRVAPLSSSSYSPGTIPVTALETATDGFVITWSAGVATAVAPLAADLGTGASNVSAAGELAVGTGAGEIADSGILAADVSTAITDSADAVQGRTALTTAGAVPFVVSSGTLTQDASNLFFDNASNELGVGTNAPGGTVHALQATLGNPVTVLATTPSAGTVPAETLVQNKVLTTNATPTTIHTFTIPASTTYAVEILVVARRTGGSAGTAEDGARYKLSAVYKNVAGTATIIGAVTTVADEDQAAWDVQLTPTGADVDVEVTGAANNNISWILTARIYTVGS